MQFELDAASLQVQREAREVARRLEPLAAAADESSETHGGVLALLRDSGLARLMIPADFGGRSERLDPLAICLVREALMALLGARRFVVCLAGHRQLRHHTGRHRRATRALAA
jgi:acyl-CoA dehydrogenase